MKLTPNPATNTQSSCPLVDWGPLVFNPALSGDMTLVFSSTPVLPIQSEDRTILLTQPASQRRGSPGPTSPPPGHDLCSG